MARLPSRTSRLSLLALISGSVVGLQASAQELLERKSLSNTPNQSTELGFELISSEPVVGEKQSRESQPDYVLESELERVTDRYPDGKVLCERTVTLDKEGNYINHGEYREFSPSGDVTVSGTYQLGKREGVRFKQCQQSDSKLLTAMPFIKFKPPFVSSATFRNDHLDGAWTIVDKDSRVVCQVELKDGIRNGTTTLYIPNGQVFSQAEYEEGLLNGHVTEKKSDGGAAQEYDYTAGHRTEVVTELHPNGKVLSTFTYLSAPLEILTSDDWETTTLATFSASPEARQLHGEFITYHDNGNVNAKGTYEHDVLVGRFESWHRNGEIAVLGDYDKGQQTGEWVWRHPNGMKKTVAKYVSGELDGQPRAWDETGKLVRHAEESIAKPDSKGIPVKQVKATLNR